MCHVCRFFQALALYIDSQFVFFFLKLSLEINLLKKKSTARRIYQLLGIRQIITVKCKIVPLPALVASSLFWFLAFGVVQVTKPSITWVAAGF